MSLRTWWVAFAGGLAFLVLIALGIARMYGPTQPAIGPAPPPEDTAPPVEAAHIMATLYFGTADGQALVPVRRDVPLATTVVAQGREILAAQLAEEAPAPYIGVVPPATALRAFYVTDRGDAFVDLSAPVSIDHPGGSANEMLTVYALVNAVTANLPAVRRVQILVDGKEVDTLAGHVDLRRPLSRNESIVRESATPN